MELFKTPLWVTTLTSLDIWLLKLIAWTHHGHHDHRQDDNDHNDDDDDNHHHWIWSAVVSRSGDLGHASPAGVRCCASIYIVIAIIIIIIIVIVIVIVIVIKNLLAANWAPPIKSNTIPFINLIAMRKCFTTLGNWSFTNVRSIWDQIGSFFAHDFFKHDIRARINGRSV